MNDRFSDGIRILHVDDDPDFADLTATLLEREDDRFDVETATDPGVAQTRLGDGDFDCVVSDYEMPGRTGIEFLQSVRQDDPDLPFILFTGKGSEAVASDAISAGVTDYLQKEGGTDQYAVLANRITNAVDHCRAQQRVERSEQRLREIIDSLPHLLYVVDADGNYRLANEALATFHDTTVEDIEGATVSEVLGTAAATQFHRHLDDVLEAETTKRISEVAVTDPEGQTHIFEPRLQPYEFGDDDRAVLGIAADVTERKARERTLDRTRERMELALEQTNAVIFDIDFETGAVTRHGTYEQFFEHAPETVPTWQEHCETVVHPDDRAAFRQFHHQLVENAPESREIEYRTNPETGDSRWIRAHVHATEDPETGRKRGLGISRDITEREERERELKQYQAYLEGSNDIITVLDESGVVKYQSPSVTRILGYGPDELLGENGFDLVHPDDVDDLSATFADLVSEPSEIVTSEARFRTADGEWRWLEVHGRNYLDHPVIEGIVTNNRDITHRKVHEKRLEALNETTRKLMAAETRADVAEIGADAAHDILDMKANAVHLYDDDQSALVPVAVTDASRNLVGDPPSFTAGDSIAWRVYEDGEPLALDDIHDDPDIHNPDSPIQSELYLPAGEYGLLIACSGETGAFDQQDVVIGDILASNVASALEQVEQTEQLRTREQELTRQNDRLEEFVSVVSHDLRNPLRVAEGRLELVQAECEHEQLDAIEGALNRMDTLIDELLTLAREGDHVQELESLALADIAENCWRNVDTADAELLTHTTRTVRANRSRLQQLLENLIRNAVEHGSTGSRAEPDDAVEHGGNDVTVSVGHLQDGFYVADDGTGLPADERDRAFAAGYSTADDGTGFGLSIVKQIVDAHGWDIAITESDAGGARFEITGVEMV